MANMDGIQAYATIVGVVADMRHRGLAAPVVSEIYFPYSQRPARTFAMTLVLRGDGEPAAFAAPLRAAVREVDPAVPVAVALVEERISAQLAPARFRTRLLAAFGLVSLLLSACGIFGVVSYSVARRRREMGIRLALGASALAVRRLVLRRALMPVLAGLFIGANAALLASRLIAGLTFGVRTADPISFVGAVGTLLCAALLAAAWPAYRAARVNPITALRTD
jgi:putative ABC transport system permease protein